MVNIILIFLIFCIVISNWAVLAQLVRYDGYGLLSLLLAGSKTSS